MDKNVFIFYSSCFSNTSLTIFCCCSRTTMTNIFSYRSSNTLFRFGTHWALQKMNSIFFSQSHTGCFSLLTSQLLKGGFTRHRLSEPLWSPADWRNGTAELLTPDKYRASAKISQWLGNHGWKMVWCAYAFRFSSVQAERSEHEHGLN